MASSTRPAALRVLILGGSSEATALAQVLAKLPDIAATVSLAGRTVEPAAQPLPVRIGGFGGVDGLAAWLKDERIDVLVDATHPFAARISANARMAAWAVGLPLIVVGRPAWTAGPDDAWTEVASAQEAAEAIGTEPKRVLLTIGRLQLAAFAAAPRHAYVIRTIDPVDPGHPLADATFIQAKGPFLLDDELRLMRDHRIEVLVTKNSGGEAARAKLDAARGLRLPVILVRRPGGEGGEGGEMTVGEAVERIRHHSALERRGV